MRKIYIVVFFIIFNHFELKAQKKIENQELLWLRYFLKINLNDSYKIRQEFEERTYWFPWRQHQLVSRTHLERKLNQNWNAAIGFTYFVQSLPQQPQITEYENQIELRPQFEIATLQEITSKISINHRYWSEFRFFEQPNGSFKYGNTRLRYQLEFRYSPIKKIYLKIFDEIHINVGNQITQNVFDQNRFGGSCQYMPFKNYGFELGYFNWFQQRNIGVDFYNRNILRFTIHHTIN